jgi:Fe-S-cluster containining protein
VRLAAFLSLSLRKFDRAYIDRVHGRLELRLRGDERRCPFLGGDAERGWCNVHPAKPAQCATYPFWPGLADHEGAWHSEREICPGIGQGPPIPGSLIQVQMQVAAATATGR